jgi:hypothetical protein
MLDSSDSDADCYSIDTYEDDLEERPPGAADWVMPLPAPKPKALEAGGPPGGARRVALVTSGYDDTSGSDVSESDDDDDWVEENELLQPRAGESILAATPL